MKGKKMGGSVTPKPYNAQGSNVEKEAEERAAGGRFKRGGAVSGGKMKSRMDRKGRARGGKAGADMSPLSTASKVTNASGHSATEGNAKN